MLNPSEIYDVDPEVAAQVEARTVNGAGPVLVHAVRGFVDAGNAGQGFEFGEHFCRRNMLGHVVERHVDRAAQQPPRPDQDDRDDD
jgi:hypothetical protein